ncbi:MAG: PLP-dependent aminotransferase family protein, partial [Acidobacteria bacterium]|nr:PLP-dependent aminotransferase family protein [Acidobacteriota bacterium]
RPAVDEFPLAQWRRLLLRQYRTENLAGLDYAVDGRGDPALRAAVASYLTRARAVECDAEQVVIVNGSQQALSLISQVLLDRGDTAALEEPGYLGARNAFQAYGARLHPVAVDEAGIVPEALPAKGARLLYVTPSHQFPTGAVLSLARRLELLQWAQATDTWVIEDDYDSEFAMSLSRCLRCRAWQRTIRCFMSVRFLKSCFPPCASAISSYRAR